MKILITGAGGMLGQDLVKALLPAHNVIGLGLKESGPPTGSYYSVDIASQALVSKTVSEHKPEVVIHAAGYTDVDKAEEERERVWAVNVKGTQFLAEAAKREGAAFFFISTDYVFDGTKQTPYDETDTPNPMSEYGKGKHAAEKMVQGESKSALIIRTSWLFGANGRNFFRSILKTACEQEVIQVVHDQRGAPTYTRDLADAFRVLVEKAKGQRGCRIYHLANSGVTTWYEAAKYLLEKADFSGKLIPIGSDQLNRPAARPANSVFDMGKIQKDFGIKMRSWKDALDEFWNDVLRHEWENLIKSR